MKQKQETKNMFISLEHALNSRTYQNTACFIQWTTLACYHVAKITVITTLIRVIMHGILVIWRPVLTDWIRHCTLNDNYIKFPCIINLFMSKWLWYCASSFPSLCNSKLSCFVLLRVWHKWRQNMFFFKLFPEQVYEKTSFLFVIWHCLKKRAVPRKIWSYKESK